MARSARLRLISKIFVFGFMAGFMAFGLAGCRGGRQLPSYATDSTVVVRDTVMIIDTFYFPLTDVTAFFECDSNLRVVMKQKDSIMKLLDTIPAVKIRTIYKDKVITKQVTKTEVKPIIIEKKVIPGWAFVSFIIVAILGLVMLIISLRL